MSDRTPPPRRRRIAGETAKPAPAAPGKKVVKKPAGPVRSKVAEAAGRVTEPVPPTSDRPRVAAPSRPKPSASTGRPGATGTVRDVVVLVAAIVVLVGGVVTAALGFKHWQGDSVRDAQEAAVSSASSATETILSYQYDQLDQHEKNAKSVMTAAYFKDEYEAKTLPALKQVAPQRKVSVKADVRNAAIVPCGEQCSSDQASVLVFVDVDRRIAGEDQATVASGRIKVDMTRVGGDWRVSNITGL